jgi:hypothetical protein
MNHVTTFTAEFDQIEEEVLSEAPMRRWRLRRGAMQWPKQ